MVTVTYPTAPAREPLIGSLLDAAQVIDSDNIGWFETGGNLWEDFSALTFGHAPTFPCNVQPDKDLDQTADWVSAFRFGAYGGTTCKTVGQDRDNTLAEVRRAFELGESTAVEQAMMETRFRVAAGENAPSGVKKWDDPVDLTPAGGAVAPKVGVALLEGWMGRRYLGRPVIHLPATIVSLLLGADGAEVEEKVLRTKLGSKIVNGVGYDFPNTGPTGAAAAANERWIYATGEVLVLRSRDVVRQAVDQSTNDVVTLAERQYLVAAEGPTAAIRVTVTP